MALTLLLAACGQRGYRNCDGVVWHTTYHIVYNSDRCLDDSIVDVFAKVDNSLSVFNPGSTVSRVNDSDTIAETDDMFRQIMTISKQANELTAGYFDPTVGPLVNLWGFGHSKNALKHPDQSEIDRALATIGINRCEITPASQVKKPHHDTEFNFSAVAKGFGCDQVAEMLARNGCSDYMVEIGGEIALSGVNPKGQPWRIMIDAPIESDSAIVHRPQRLIEPQRFIGNKCGIATSGNYRNYRTDSTGVKTWHTISPLTGMPAITQTLSATVLAADCATADALATGCMAMPTDTCIKLSSNWRNVHVILVADSVYELGDHGIAHKP